MTPAQALIARLTSSGVTLRLEGDTIVHRGPRCVLSPDVLAKLSQHKAEAIAELKRLGSAGPPSPAGTAKRAATIAEIDRFDHITADAKAPAEFGLPLRSALADASRRRTLGQLDALPSPTDSRGIRLLDQTRTFLASPWLALAVVSDWPLIELFGICPVAPVARIDRQGLVTGLALSVHAGAEIVHLGPDLARVRHCSGNLATYRKGQPAMAEAVLWWQCATLIGGD